MNVLSIVLLSVALFFIVATIIAVVLIRRAPRIQVHETTRSPVPVSKRKSDGRKIEVRWTQLDKTTQLRRKRSEGTAAFHNF